MSHEIRILSAYNGHLHESTVRRAEHLIGIEVDGKVVYLDKKQADNFGVTVEVEPAKPWKPKSETLKKPKKPFLDQPSKRMDARPGETEGQYQKRVAPLAKASRKAEKDALNFRARALARIR